MAEKEEQESTNDTHGDLVKANDKKETDKGEIHNKATEDLVHVRANTTTTEKDQVTEGSKNQQIKAQELTRASKSPVLYQKCQVARNQRFK